MTIESDFKELMTQDIVIRPLVSRDGYGEPTYSNSPVSLKGVVVYETKHIRADDNKELLSRAHAFIFGVHADIKADSLVTLPDGSQPKVLYVQRVQDESGDHHDIIYFG